MPKILTFATALLVAVVGAAVLAQKAATRTADNDWPMYSRDFTGSRFSPLADIDTSNVSQLTQAWAVQLTAPAGRRGGGPAPAAGAAPAVAQGRGAAAGGRGGGAAGGGGDDGDADAVTSNPQVTPIVVDGVMYLPARGNQVLALDADTGQEIWRYQMPQFVTSDARGVAYWPGEAGLGPRILVTAGPRLLALDAATGASGGRVRPRRLRRDHGAVAGRAGHLQARGDSRCLSRARCRSARPATRARSTCAPARSSGSSTRCRCPANSGTRRGSTTDGATDRARTSGPTT